MSGKLICTTSNGERGEKHLFLTICTCRLLELWQRLSSSGQAGTKLALQTRAAFQELAGGDLSGTSLWALLKVIAAESPATSVSGFDADPARVQAHLQLDVSFHSSLTLVSWNITIQWHAINIFPQ